MNKSLTLSVCIPSYNRVEYLEDLLYSIESQQNCLNYEIVICEDCSPERSQIASLVKEFSFTHANLNIRYIENERNLGYDGNIRRLIELARGDYCLFLGNDDLLCRNALSVISTILKVNTDCGVVVRSYATFDLDPNQIKQEFRYFPEEMKIPPGVDAITTAFRRSVVIPGLVLHRESALQVATLKYDGTLLYQLYLVGRMLAFRSVIFTPEIIALRRDGNLPDFGNSEAERGKFVPHEQTVDSSICFISGMISIARGLELETGLKVFSRIRSDIARYSYPILAIQSRRPKLVFVRYAFSLVELGLGCSILFYCYFFSLLVMGPKFMDTVILYLKSKIGHAPRFGKIG